MTESAYPIISIEEAWQRVAAAVHRLEPLYCPLVQLLGRVLAETVVATEDMPPFPASAMDGYAVIAAEGAGERVVVGEQPAGPRLPLHVEPGTAVRIMTGAPLPDGADAVVRVEDTREAAGRVTLLASVAPGQYVRPAGQDVAVGETVLEPGSVLGPAEIGLLAMVGRAEALVYPQPRVAVMATGDELVPPGQPPAPGQIRDSNSYALLAAVEAAGGKPLHLGLVRDQEAALEEAMLRGVSEADMLLTSGGVSMGTHDLIKPLLERHGVVHFGRVATRPGLPLTFATLRGVPVFGLPGFPVSSLVAFENFVRPALRLLMGHDKLWRPEVQARLSHALRHPPDRVEFQRAVVTKRDGEYWAETTGVQVSGRLKSLAGANALLRLPAGMASFAQGDLVTALLINQPENH